MEIEEFITDQAPDRQPVLTKNHHAVLANDTTVAAQIEQMMGKEMIMYKAKGLMKYALASVKKHMSLHVLPIYGSKTLHEKYQALLPDANFQKGCINFNNEDEMPIDIVQQLIKDCSTIDLAKIREDYLKSKKAK